MTDDEARDLEPGETLGTPGPDAEQLQAAWDATVADMEAMADGRREQGLEVFSYVAGDTVPDHPNVGDTDRFGLAFVVPDERARKFEETFRRGSYPTYEVYRKEFEGLVFIVVEYVDEDAELAIQVAGQYRLRNAAEMVTAAEMTDEMYTHHQTADGRVLGTFHHDSHEKFVPHADRIEEFTDAEVEFDVDLDELG